MDKEEDEDDDDDDDDEDPQFLRGTPRLSFDGSRSVPASGRAPGEPLPVSDAPEEVGETPMVTSKCYGTLRTHHLQVMYIYIGNV